MSAVSERAISDHRITTDRLEIRVVDVNDIQHYLELMTDAEVMKHIGVEAGKLMTRDEVRSMIDGAVNGWRMRGCGRWSVFDRVTNEFIGFAGFRCEGGVPELIIVVHERFWRNGYASDAARAALDHGFAELGFRVVCAFTRPANDRARELLDNLGAEFLGQTDFHGVNGAAYRIHPKKI